MAMLLDARAGGEMNIRHLGNARHQRRLQVGAVSHEVGRPPARFSGLSKWHARQFAQRRCVLQHHRFRPHRCWQQPVEHAELAKDACCIGRKLEAGAYRFYALRLFEHLHGVTVFGEGQRRGQPGDARPGDDDLPGAHVVHWQPVAGDQAAWSM